MYRHEGKDTQWSYRSVLVLDQPVPGLCRTRPWSFFLGPILGPMNYSGRHYSFALNYEFCVTFMYHKILQNFLNLVAKLLSDINPRTERRGPILRQTSPSF
jgi:hypothetical protein